MHITCSIYKKHSQFLQVPKSTFITNMLNLLWSETAAHLHSTLIFQVVLGPIVLFLYISKAVTRYLDMQQKIPSPCLNGIEKRGDQQHFITSYKVPLELYTTSSWEIMPFITNSMSWCIFSWDVPLVISSPQEYSKHFRQTFFLVHLFKHKPKPFP